MTVLVDADSIPSRIREIICSQAVKREINAAFFANRPIPLPPGSNVTMHVVDDADEAIVESASPRDLVITHDIPLAARLVEAGVVVLNDRGARFTGENIRERLSTRDFIKELRDSGLHREKPRGFGPQEVREFANAFDRELTKRLGSGAQNHHVAGGQSPAASLDKAE